MIDFLKIFGEGFLFFIGLPFILLGLVVYGIYLLIVFLVMSIKGIILFFKGKKYSMTLNEDLEAEKILENGLPNSNPVVQTNTNTTTNNVVYNTYHVNVSTQKKDTNNNENNNYIDVKEDTPLLDELNLLEDNNNGEQ